MAVQLTKRQMAILESGDPNFQPEFDDPVDNADQQQETQSTTTQEEVPVERDYLNNDGEFEEENLNEEENNQESGEEEGQEESWITDDVVEDASFYKMTRKDLEEFQSVEEYDRFARMMDQRFLNNNPMQRQVEPEQKQTEQPQQTIQETTVAEDISDEMKRIQKILETPDEYDDELVAMAQIVKSNNDKFQQQNEDLQRQRELDEINQFHQAVDSLNQEKLVGRLFDDNGVVGNLRPVQEAYRQEIYQVASTLASNIHANGGEIPPMNALVRKAAKIALADEMAHSQTEEKANKLKKQTRKRRPASTTSNRQVETRTEDDGSFDEGEEARRILNVPNVKRFLNNRQQV